MDFYSEKSVTMAMGSTYIKISGVVMLGTP